VAVVRALGPDEWELLRDLRLRSLTESPDAFGSTLAREQSFDEEDWRRRLQGPVVVVEDPEPVALGGTFEQDGVLHVWGMWTHPSHRGGGHARRVLDALLDNAERAILHVNLNNPGARRVYERYGFVGTGELEPLRPGSDQLIELMSLTRTPTAESLPGSPPGA
jgi:ribosomal protein S18 acetylase RimI-like enzyme